MQIYRGWACVAAVALLGLTAGPGSALAQAYHRDQPGSYDEQIACTPDVFRLCSNEIPDTDRIVACLKSNRPQLSRACGNVFFGSDDGASRRAPESPPPGSGSNDNDDEQ